MGHKVVRKSSCLEMTTSLPLSNSLARAGHIPHHSRRGGRTDKCPRSPEGEKRSSSLMNTRGSTASSGASWSGYATLAPTYGSFIPTRITRAAPPSLTSSEFPDTTSVQEVAVLQVNDIVTAEFPYLIDQMNKKEAHCAVSTGTFTQAEIHRIRHGRTLHTVQPDLQKETSSNPAR